ncbi:MAG: sugar phosphate isomerase/epimerase [Clostridia bacterium]|nr:sugar phosphate isomerase/epimerase [Clostridia bacterium]
MKLSITAQYLQKIRGTDIKRSNEECIRLCAEAGFEALDVFPDVLKDSWEEETNELISASNKYGLELHQGHVPLNRYRPIPVDEFRVYKMRSVDAALKMGLKYLVLHADEYWPKESYDTNKALEFIYEDLAPVVEYAKSKNVNIAIENVFEENYRAPYPGCRTRFSSTNEELLSIIQKFNDPSVTCCWDFGHGYVQHGKEMLSKLKEIGNLVTCTHVHDNYYERDLHLPPFFGNVDWENCVSWLYESGYKGNFSLELVYGSIPDFLLPGYLKMAADSAKWMLKEYMPKT